MSLVKLYSDLLAKAQGDPSHGGKLQRVPVPHHDGRTVHHWKRLDVDTSGFLPVVRSVTPHPYEVLSSDPHALNILEDLLAHPDGARITAGALSRPPTVPDLLRALSVPRGATVESIKLDQPLGHPFGRIDLTAVFSHPDLGLERMSTKISLDGGNNPVDGRTWTPNTPRAFLNLVRVDPAKRGQGLGAALLLAHVRALDDLGFEFIRLNAYRDDAQDFNGYYTWAVLGFDGALEDANRRVIAREYTARTGQPFPPSVTTVQGVLGLPGGRQLWREYGDSTYMTFTVARGTPSRDALEQRLALTPPRVTVEL